MNERREKQQMWYFSIWKNEERTINGMSSDLKFLLLTYLTNNRIKTHIPNKKRCDSYHQDKSFVRALANTFMVVNHMIHGEGKQ